MVSANPEFDLHLRDRKERWIAPQDTTKGDSTQTARISNCKTIHPCSPQVHEHHLLTTSSRQLLQSSTTERHNPKRTSTIKKNNISKNYLTHHLRYSPGLMHYSHLKHISGDSTTFTKVKVQLPQLTLLVDITTAKTMARPVLPFQQSFVTKLVTNFASIGSLFTFPWLRHLTKTTTTKQ